MLSFRKTPRIWSAKRIIIDPPIISIVLLYSWRSSPSVPRVAPSIMKTIENPRENITACVRIFLLWVLKLSISIPLIYAKYEGMIGNMHGENIERTPAVKAMKKFIFIVVL